MNAIKLKKIEAELVRVISDILYNEANDSLLKTITITGCEVSNDLSFAKVYFTSLTDMDHTKLVKEMDEAAGYIRGNVSNMIQLRYTPKLKFYYDDSIEYGNNIEKILNKIHEEK